MHLKRQSASKKLPIPRKGTAFIARALSNIDSSVPVVIAVRDILKLARTTREVKKMIDSKLLKINGRVVKDYRESLSIFNILEAGKNYVLTLLPTGKFTLQETKENERICKITNKKLLRGNKLQLNLHDGTNLISNEKFKVGDSLVLDFSGKVKKHIKLEKGKDVIVIVGKYIGRKGKIHSLENNKASITLDDKKSTILNQSQIVAQ